MNFKAITITDIAKALNISASTVSKALSDSYEISAKTKQIVLTYAREHNYRPNPNAISLKFGSSLSIGIVIPSIQNQFFAQIIDGIESVAHQEGFTVIIAQTHESYDMEVKSIQQLTHRAIDGLLISQSSETRDISHLKQLRSKGLPVVFFDRVSEQIETHKVVTDNFQGALNATQHLFNNHYRKIALITGPEGLSITKDRLDGYLQAHAQNKTEVTTSYIKHCSYTNNNVEEITSAVHELLELPDKPDAIFTTSDTITSTVLLSLNKLDIKIPEQLAVVGFTNSSFAAVVDPPLTSVFQPGFLMGQKAAELLLSLVKSKKAVTEFETIVLPMQLVIRESSYRSVKL
nr:LacI family DNA-binding transcriptional regulator [Mucilaginibacter sp. L294]